MKTIAVAVCPGFGRILIDLNNLITVFFCVVPASLLLLLQTVRVLLPAAGAGVNGNIFHCLRLSFVLQNVKHHNDYPFWAAPAYGRDRPKIELEIVR